MNGDLHMLVKKSPGTEKMRKSYDRALKALIKSGRYQKALGRVWSLKL